MRYNKWLYKDFPHKRKVRLLPPDNPHCTYKWEYMCLTEIKWKLIWRTIHSLNKMGFSIPRITPSSPYNDHPHSVSSTSLDQQKLLVYTCNVIDILDIRFPPRSLYRLNIKYFILNCKLVHPINCLNPTIPSFVIESEELRDKRGECTNGYLI